MNHNAGAQAGLIGEYAPLHAPGNGSLDTTAHDAAAYSLHRKSALENGDKGRSYISGIENHQNQRAHHVGDRHHGNQLFGHRRNPLQAAHHHQRSNDHQQCAGDPIGDRESAFHIGGDGIDLTHVADAEAGQNTENTEKKRQHFTDGLAAPEAAQTVPQIVHGTAGPLPRGILPAVVDTKHVFGEIGHHTENRHNPHPEDGAGAAGHNGRGDTRDVTGADGRCQRRTQALELTDGTILFAGMGHNMLIPENGSNGVGKPVFDVAQLKSPGKQRHQYARAHQQHQHGNAPYKIVDFSVYLFH